MHTSSSSRDTVRERDTQRQVSSIFTHFNGLQVPPIHGVSDERSASEALVWGISKWPELLALRRAANTLRFSRFTFEIGRVITSAHVAFAAALLAKQCPSLELTAPSVGLALQYYRILRYVILQHMSALRRAWHLTDEQCAKLHSSLSSLVGPIQHHQGPHTWQEQRRPADWESEIAKYIDGRQPQPGSARIVMPINSGPPAGAGREPPEGPHPQCDKFEHLIPCFFASLAAGWPLSDALRTWSDLASRTGAFSTDGRCFYVSGLRLPPVKLQRQGRRYFVLPTAFNSTGIVVVVFQGHIAFILAKVDMAGVRKALIRLAEAAQAIGHSRFFPAFIRLPHESATSEREGRVQFPQSSVLDLYDRRENWERIMGSVMDGTTRAIINGLLVMPLRAWPSEVIHEQNHASWELDPAAQFALGPTIARWLAGGWAEFIDLLAGHMMPQIIEPLGAVGKSTHPLFRLITDGRRGNGSYLPWGVVYHGIRDVCLVLRRGDFFWLIDITDAYHTALYAGCEPGVIIHEKAWVIDENGRVHWGNQRFMGCSPRTCRGVCDKCLSGFRIGWCVFRFACTQFGKATAHGPLNAYVMCMIRYFESLPVPVTLQAWVDDILSSLRAVVHEMCNGAEGGCVTCLANREVAQAAYQNFQNVLQELNVRENKSKGFGPDQKGAFMGIFMNSIIGRLNATPAKIAGLTQCLLDLCKQASATRTELAKGRGKLVHYGQAIPYLGAIPTEFSREIEHGAIQPIRWNQAVLIRQRLQRAMEYALTTIAMRANDGRPMWPLPASSAYRLFLSGQTDGLRIATITWDASAAGWGAAIYTNPFQPPDIIVGTFSAQDAGEFNQPTYREARAGALALQAATQRRDLTGWTVVLRNDCTGALANLRKGCIDCESIQDQANSCALLARDLRCELLFLHAPGSQLVAERVDGLSRVGVRAVQGPTIRPELANAVHLAADNFNWRISVDLFATSANKQCLRFFSQFAEPDSEGEDAIAQTDWNTSVCPCGCIHREVFYAFPPERLIPSFIHKAAADRARGILIVPYRVTAPYWSRLKSASLTDGRPHSSFKNPAKLFKFAGTFKPLAIALFALDFDDQTRGSNSHFAPPCGQESNARPRPSKASDRDISDRFQIEDALRRRAAALDASPSSSGSACL